MGHYNLILEGLYAVNEQCLRCSKSLVANLSSPCASIWTPHPWTLYLLRNGTELIAQTIFTFGEQGHYNVVVDMDGFPLYVEEAAAPVNSLLPFFLLLATISIVAIILFSYKPLWDFLMYHFYPPSPSTYTFSALPSSPIVKDTEGERTKGAALTERLLHDHYEQPATTSRSEKASPSSKTRLSSLDTFRGLSLTLMIFVNYGGGGYWLVSEQTLD